MQRPNRATAACRVVLIAISTLLLLLVTAGGAGAHAAFVESDPAPGAVLPEPPAEVRVRFSEPLEPAGSGAVLLAADGVEVPGVGATVDPGDPHVLVVALPGDLGDGAYALSWRNLSAVDGHGQRGFFPFTVGASDGAVAASVAQGGGGETAVAAFGRWLGVTGLAAQAAIWPLWLFVARPALAATGSVHEGARRSRRLARAGFAIGLAAAVVTLFAQGLVALPGDPVGGALALLSGSRWGWLWLARLAGICLLAALLERSDWERSRPRSLASVAALALSLLVPVPFALNAHAAAVLDGAATAIAAQYVHVAGAAFWAGGLVLLSAAVIPSVWPAGDAARRSALAIALPRFSAVAGAVWVLLAISGVYAAWLHVGSLPALLTPGYGLALLGKLLFLLPILALAALNRWRFLPRIERSAGGPAPAAPAARRARGSVRWELMLALPVFLLAAFMASSEPARDVFRSEQPAELRLMASLAGSGPDSASVTVAPGAPGLNRFTVEAAGQQLPAGSEALLRISLPALDIPQRTVPLVREEGNRFAGEDTLPAAGDWEAEVVVRQIGAFNASGSVTIPIAAVPPRPPDPAPAAPGFGPLGALGVVLSAVLLVAGAVASVRGSRRAGLPLGLAGVAAGAVLLFVARVQPASAPVVAAPTSATPIAAVASPTTTHHDHHPGTPASAMDHAMHHPTPDALPALGEAQVIDGLSITLAEGPDPATFAIDVADADGNPVDSATVAVSARHDDADGARSSPVTGSAEPAADGRFETGPLDLDAGSWRVTVRVSPRGEPSRSASWRVVAPAR